MFRRERETQDPRVGYIVLLREHARVGRADVAGLAVAIIIVRAAVEIPVRVVRARVVIDRTVAVVVLAVARFDAWLRWETNVARILAAVLVTIRRNAGHVAGETCAED